MRIDVDEKRKFHIIDEIKERFKNAKDEIIDIDGIRLQNSLGWFLIRASNTQNQITCRTESTTRENLFLLKKIVEDQLSKSGVNYNIKI